jgi:hypothetical protein
MSFIHYGILYGLILAGVPLLLHLIARQKPKILRFPAFRFLQQRHRSNRRKLRLQHLLLLLMRMGLIAALCLALAGPKLKSSPWSFSGERAVSAVLVIDTSPSMEYSSSGVTRLDEARQRARELLEEMSDGSQVAILDSGEDNSGGDWLSPSLAGPRLDGLRTRPAAGAVNHAIDRGFRLLADLAQGDDVPPRFLYVFSDRTRASWDGFRPTCPEGVHAVFVDLGVETPRDLAIDRLEAEPPAVNAGAPMQLRVTLRATGGDFDTELVLRIDNDTEEGRPPDRRPVRLSAGQSQVIVFERPAPQLAAGAPREAAFQVTAQLASTDALPFNNIRHTTFLVRQKRKVLTLVGAAANPDLPPWFGWEKAIQAVQTFECEARPLGTAKLDLRTLQGYPVVCLFQVAPDEATWKLLGEYVRQGGGLVVVPGGEEWVAHRVAFNERGRDLLPAPFEKIVTTPPDTQPIPWARFSKQHALTAAFAKMIETGAPDIGTPEGWPALYAYWETGELVPRGATALASLAKGKARTVAERVVGKGKVIELTTPLDFRWLDKVRRWDTYTQSSFPLVLIDQICRYLAGDSSLPELNFLCGQPVQLTVLPGSPPYTLQGPGLTAAEGRLQPPDRESRLNAPQAVMPGNFVVSEGREQRTAAAFSLNTRAEESQLEKVPVEEIEPVLGAGAVLQVGRSISLKEALQGLQPPPVDLLPYLLIAVLLGLAIEAFLANRFYRQAAPDASAPPEPAVAVTARSTP